MRLEPWCRGREQVLSTTGPQPHVLQHVLFMLVQRVSPVVVRFEVDRPLCIFISFLSPLPKIIMTILVVGISTSVLILLIFTFL